MILYQVLAGHPPFQEKLCRRRDGDADDERATATCAAVSLDFYEDVVGFVHKLLARQPSARPSMEVVAEGSCSDSVHCSQRRKLRLEVTGPHATPSADSLTASPHPRDRFQSHACISAAQASASRFGEPSSDVSVAKRRRGGATRQTPRCHHDWTAERTPWNGRVRLRLPW